MMLPKSVRFFLLFVSAACLLLDSQLFAQQNDAGLWTSVNFETKIVKKLTFNLSEEFRFNENITELGAYFTDIGLDYKINKHFQVSANYRFIQRRRTDDYYSFRHRYYAALKYSKKLKPFELTYRLQFLDQYEDIGRASDGGIPICYLRNKLSVKWDTKKPVTPYVSIEVFSPLNYPRQVVFDNIRTQAGIEYTFTKHQKIEVYYLINKEINVSNPETNFVLGLGYYYKL
jgi:hypothetical protein